MKKLLNNIQELLDFYFGDANLNHDRFLRKEIEKDADGYVDLSTMLKFNKLKQLTSDTAILAKAVGNSSSLQLNDGSTRVKRKEKLKDIENVDSRTVYVEEFPTNTDHDWIKSVFSTCGAVKYISLPKYKHNNQVKGFAFVEFSTEDEARKACQVLNTIQCKQKKRLSTNSNNGDNSAKKRNKKRRSNSESENNGNVVRQNTKRRRSMSESSEGSPVKTNRRKRQSSFCSIDENDNDNNRNININEPQDVEKKANDSNLNTTKRKRTRDSSVSSEGEGRSVKIKSNNPKTDKTEKIKIDISIKKEEEPTVTKIENTDTPPKEETTSTLTPKITGRKRKASNPKEREQVNENLEMPKGDKVLKSCEHSDEQSTAQSEIKSELKSKTKTVSHDTSGDSQNKCVDVHVKKELTDDTSKDLATHSTNEQKRKISLTSDEEHDLPEKKIKVELPETTSTNGKETLEKQEHEKKDNSNGNVDNEEKKKKKKNRQHKRKGEKNSNEVPKIPPLHVISKCEWLTLKKEYKRLQRIKMSELKRNLKVLKIEQVRRSELKERIYKSIAAKSETTELPNRNDAIEKDFEKEKENYEGSAVIVQTENENSTKPKGLQLTPGTVVALKTSSENLTRIHIKSTLSSFGEVAYVDYVDGVYQGYVRFTSTGDLEKVMSLDDAVQQAWVFQLRKLSSEEENEYFRKAEEKRLQKYNRDQRKKRKKGRGVDKITQDVESVSNHLHFS